MSKTNQKFKGFENLDLKMVAEVVKMRDDLYKRFSQIECQFAACMLLAIITSEMKWKGEADKECLWEQLKITLKKMYFEFQKTEKAR